MVWVWLCPVFISSRIKSSRYCPKQTAWTEGTEMLGCCLLIPRTENRVLKLYMHVYSKALRRKGGVGRKTRRRKRRRQKMRRKRKVGEFILEELAYAQMLKIILFMKYLRKGTLTDLWTEIILFLFHKTCTLKLNMQSPNFIKHKHCTSTSTCSSTFLIIFLPK